MNRRLLLIIVAWMVVGCSIRDQLVELRANGESARSAIQAGVGVACHVGMRLEKTGGEPVIVVTVRLDDVPSLNARDLKANIGAMVQRSFQGKVTRVDLIL